MGRRMSLLRKFISSSISLVWTYLCLMMCISGLLYGDSIVAPFLFWIFVVYGIKDYCSWEKE